MAHVLFLYRNPLCSKMGHFEENKLLISEFNTLISNEIKELEEDKSLVQRGIANMQYRAEKAKGFFNICNNYFASQFFASFVAKEEEVVK